MNLEVGRRSGKDAAASEAERKVRRDLAAAYRLVALAGWDDLIYTHISARVPGAHDEFLLAATAQNLRKLAQLIPMPQPAVAP